MPARFLPNERSAVALTPTRAPLAFHRRLPGYAPTPLLDAPALARDLGVAQVWLKDESSRLGLPAFKILGASWAVYCALRARGAPALQENQTLAQWTAALAPLRPLTLATATDGNHGRAVAHMAKLLGLDARIFVPAGTAQARLDGIASEGARVQVIDGSYDDAVARAAEEAGERCLVISDTSWPGYEEVPRHVAEGYSTILWEIDDALAQRGAPEPTLVAVQFGVGALAAAVVRHYRAPGRAPEARILSVEPVSAACALASIEAGEIVRVPGPHHSIMAGLNCGQPSLIAWPDCAAGIDGFLAIEDERARAAMRALAREGVVAGETGAAGLAGLLELSSHADWRAALQMNEKTRVLLFVTEGATDPAAYGEIVQGRDISCAESGPR